MTSEATASSSLPIVNIAAYRFATLQDLQSLRTELLALCRIGQLRGTILLSTEGINLFMAGEAEAIESLLARLRREPGAHQIVIQNRLIGRIALLGRQLGMRFGEPPLE